MLIMANLKAQPSKLDEKYGFNKFQLSSHLNEIKLLAKLAKVKSDKNDTKNIARYEVKDIDEYRLFGYNLGRIELIFYKSHLLEIQVYLKDYTNNQKERGDLISNDIGRQIEKEYGQFVERQLSTKDTLYNIAASGQIVGKHVTLVVTDFFPQTYNYVTTYRGMCYAFISRHVYELQESEEKKQSGL